VAGGGIGRAGKLARGLGGAVCHHGANSDRQFISLFLAVSLFDAASFQHSPANMGFFSLAAGVGVGPGWGLAIGWSIIPAALGNLLGGTLLVVFPIWLAIGSKHRYSVIGSPPGDTGPAFSKDAKPDGS
jgi:formate transporter